MRTGVTTLAHSCPWWPRLLPLMMAAGYCGMNLARFHAIPELEAMIRDIGGQKVVDIHDLDNWIEQQKGQSK